MKKLAIVATILIFSSLLVSAQVPDNLKNKFMANHPSATAIVWNTVDAGLYKVAYDELGAKHVIVYDKDMNAVWRRNELASAEVPAAITEYFKTTYPAGDYKVLVEDENGNTLYYTSKSDSKSDTKTVYLDKEGRVIKTVYESKDYPKNIASYYTKNYPEENYAVYSEDSNGIITFYTVRKGKLIHFDKAGNYLREVRYYDYDYDAP